MFHKCVNSIKLSILYNKKGFIIENNKNNLEILKIFLKINVIKCIKINNNNKILILINYINNKPVFKNITNLFRPGQKLTISLKNLKKISLKYNWIIILSTSKGVMNNFDAIKKNVGGIIISKIWN